VERRIKLETLFYFLRRRRVVPPKLLSLRASFSSNLGFRLCFDLSLAFGSCLCRL